MQEGSVNPQLSGDEELIKILQRGLCHPDGQCFNQTLTSQGPEQHFSLKITAEKITVETVLFTLIDVTAEYDAVASANYQARHDPLTGLLNRRGLMPSLEQFLNNGMPFAIMVSDVDRFKSVNDVLGHPAGDGLLVEVSTRLQSTLRPGDLLARTGGDEFVAVLPGITSPDSAGELASRLTEVLKEPYMLGDRRVLSGCSFGVYLSSGESTENAENMLSAADIALYAAKSSGRSSFVIFSDELAAQAAERFSIENDLRGALRNGEIHILYQPVVNGITEEVVSYEALLRWLHPVRGSVAPDVFIPLSEKTGLIHEIGIWVLEQACREFADSPGEERLAVNLSPLQFRNPHLTDLVKNTLMKSGLDPRRLEIEITESALIENPEDSYRVIREFRRIGIHVVLDDFGTGFSSLSHLRSNLFSKIKIDRSFISDLNRDEGSTAIVNSVLSLCNQLHLEVTAEGVETPEQAEWLRSRGCTLLQGYLYGRPAPRST